MVATQAKIARSTSKQGPLICERGGADAGLFFPAGGDWEADWPRATKIVVYGSALAWCFLGVAIIAEIFMTAIEAITSKKKRIFDKNKQRYRTIKIWNETIANLTLMALGSSAPEILLNVVEVGKNRMFAGELGPGTIVGSAAFNLFCITAVCVMAIPSEEVRLIKDVTVYVVTASFSVFAYLWLVVILTVFSKDVVTVPEALLTLLFFPVLVLLAFFADKGWIGGQPASAQRQRIAAAEMTPHELAELFRKIREEFGDLDEDMVAILAEKQTVPRPSMAAYHKKLGKASKTSTWSSAVPTKHECKDSCTASTEVLWGPKGSLQSLQSAQNGNLQSLQGFTTAPSSMPDVQAQATVEFARAFVAVKEGDGRIEVEVQRNDNPTSIVTVSYRTRDGSAHGGADFLHVAGKVRFGVNETSKKIPVTILDDERWESDEEFYIELYDVKCDRGTAVLGKWSMVTITIIDDDDPGCLSFEREYIEHDEDNHEGTVNVRVIRNHGSTGEISCKYKTEDDTAVAPLDYVAVSDELVLKDGEMAHDIPICINARGRYDRSDTFRLILYDPVICRFNSETDGDDMQDICTIVLKASHTSKAAVDKLAQTLAYNWCKARVGTTNWKEQFSHALLVGGSMEEQRSAGLTDWCFHLMCLPWKLVFAATPPPDFGGGWLCFIIALVFIGLVTAIIGDLASLFGCALMMPDQITAITFVALGTSLPDTFASKAAAQQDPYADASITNITGSNSVNVFLGLGLPWTVTSIYWWVNGQSQEWRERAPDHVLKKYDQDAAFVLEAGALSFSVGVFTVCAVCTMMALLLRRKLFGGELGGPYVPKLAAAIYLVALWLLYVTASWIYIALE